MKDFLVYLNFGIEYDQVPLFLGSYCGDDIG